MNEVYFSVQKNQLVFGYHQVKSSEIMATITLVKARSIFDSRGNPTVEVDIYLSDGYLSRAAVPSGASTGVYEALELRDGGKNYMGKGVSKAVESVNKIIGPALIGKDPVEQTGIDDFMVQELDGTQNQWGWCKQKNNNGSQKISGSELIKLYEPFIEDYPIVSIEDPFDQDNWAHYAQFTATIGEKVQIVGDDLLVTNPKRVGKAINEKSCNALLLKVNEIGSVTESIEEVKMFKRAGCGVMTSHRSGETEDTFIADLAVGLATGQIKTGASCMQVMDNSWMNTLSFVDLIVRGNTAQVLVEALVDTGATHNFMKTWLAREVGLTIVPCNAEVTALNSNVEVKGLAHKVPVQIEDWTGQLDFTVMEMKNFDVILGQDFLKGNKATVIPYLDVVALDGQPRNWTFTTHRQQMGGVIVERFA